MLVYFGLDFTNTEGIASLIRRLLPTAVKHCVRLRNEAKYRTSTRRLLISGEDILEELVQQTSATEPLQVLQLYAVNQGALDKWGEPV